MTHLKLFPVLVLVTCLSLLSGGARAEDYYVPSPPGQNPIPSHFVATTATVQHVPLPNALGSARGCRRDQGLHHDLNRQTLI